MALEIVPSFAHIRSLSLAVTMRERSLTRVINRKGNVGPDVTEIWAGSVEFAALNRANGAALAAFFEGLGGREAPFLLPLNAGFASHTGGPASGTVTSSTRDTVTLSVSGTGIVLAGTLIGIGSTASADYQMCEVLADAVFSSTVTLSLAPRLRTVPAPGTSVVIGSVYGKFNLLTDELGGYGATVSHSQMSIDIIEALK